MNERRRPPSRASTPGQEARSGARSRLGSGVLDWITALRDPYPLASERQARKFVASLDRDLFVAFDQLETLLRRFRDDDERRSVRNFTALLALDEASRPLYSRIEHDYLTAAEAGHSLRDRLWSVGYELAQRFAEAYLTHFDGEARARTRSEPATFAAVSVRLLLHRTTAYRYRLYRHEEWVPAIWLDINASFRAICDLGLEQLSVPLEEGRSTRAVAAFSILQLLRLANAGAFTPSQTFALWQRLTEFAHDARLTPRPTGEDGFYIDLSGHEGLRPRHQLSDGGQFLFLDTSAIFHRFNAWLDQLEREFRDAAQTPARENRPAAALLALRSAVLRIDPRFKPLMRASVRTPHSGRLLTALGIAASAATLTYDPRVIASALDGTQSEDSRAELRTMGQLTDSLLGRLPPDLPAEIARLDVSFWCLRDRSDLGYRVVVDQVDPNRFRLRDLALVSEDPPNHGWQVAFIARLVKLPAGQVELGLQVISRDAETVELELLEPSRSRDDAPQAALGKTFRALRLRSAFHAQPLLGTTWIVPLADFTQGTRYRLLASGRQFETQQVLADGPTWVWIKPAEVSAPERLEARSQR
ncbi:MAG: hypothetical protein N3F11_08700 [Casimicrobiaceae bacterium]|nr:hypothetical protein [Casimicrobiaceae bacterium]